MREKKNEEQRRDLDSLDSLIVHLSRLDVSRHRVGEVTKFTNIRRRMDVDPLCMVVEGRIGGGKTGRQPAVHSRVHQLCALRKEKLSNVMQ